MRYRVLMAAVALLLVPALSQSSEEDGKLVQGIWTVAGYDMDGKELPADLAKKVTVTIRAGSCQFSERGAATKIWKLAQLAADRFDRLSAWKRLTSSRKTCAGNPRPKRAHLGPKTLVQNGPTPNGLL